MYLLYLKLSSLRNNRSINLNLPDHVHFWRENMRFAGKYDDRHLQSKERMGDYRYHELRPLISYFPCHWVVPVDFPNTCAMKIVSILDRIIARYGRDIYTLTQYFPNQQWYNKSTYDLVERLLFPMSFYRRYIKFKERYLDVSKFRMIFNLIYLSSI